MATVFLNQITSFICTINIIIGFYSLILSDIRTKPSNIVFMSKRQSNIELLRIISIFLIMVVHATYLTFGTPTPQEIQVKPIGSFFFIGLENISVICVDIFVLISGWFGIHPKVKSIGGLLFQCVYFGLIMAILFGLTGIQPLGATTLAKCVVNYPHFVMCYIVMYLMTPVLNAFVERASRIQFRNMLIGFYVWAFLFGWFLHTDNGFAGGNSALSFIGLYLLARYIRIHCIFPSQLQKARIWGIIWFATVLIVTTTVWASSYFGFSLKVSNVLLNMTTSYLSPNVILAAVSLLLCFAHIQLKSKAVNWIAASAFASVLTHGYAMNDVYIPLIQDLYKVSPLVTFLCEAVGIMLAYLIVSVVLDKPRMYLWGKVYPHLDRWVVSRFRR